MKPGTLIKIKKANQLKLGEHLLQDQLAIWLRSKLVHKTKWHLVVLCHNNKEEAIFNLKAEVINES